MNDPRLLTLDPNAAFDPADHNTILHQLEHAFSTQTNENQTI